MTGGYGCIGSWVAERLVARGLEVSIFDLREDTHRLQLLLDEEGMSQIHFIEGDVADPTSLRKAAEESEATHLLHLAALQVPLCRADPMLGAKVNVLGTLGAFETARVLKGQIDRLVFASSAAVHGPAKPGGPAVGDEVRLNPVTHYGAFKVCNELNAKVYWLDHGVSSLAIRPWTVYGVGRDFGMTSEPTKAIKAVAADRDYQISYGGQQDLQYVGDVADTFIRLLEAPFEGAESFNVRGEVVSIERFVEALEKAVPESRGRVRHGSNQLPIAPSLDDTRLQAAFGPLPQTSLEEGIKETYQRFVALRDQGRLDLGDLER